MFRSQIQDLLYSVLKKRINNSQIIDEKTDLKNIPNWDSLEHISILSDIEKAFKIKLSMQEIISIKTIGELIDLIQLKCK